MTFEEVLPELKKGKKAVRTEGWGGSEEYIFVVDNDTLNGEKVNPYLMIRTKEEPVFRKGRNFVVSMVCLFFLTLSSAICRIVPE